MRASFHRKIEIGNVEMQMNSRSQLPLLFARHRCAGSIISIHSLLVEQGIRHEARISTAGSREMCFPAGAFLPASPPLPSIVVYKRMLHRAHTVGGSFSYLRAFPFSFSSFFVVCRVSVWACV